ncbi:MAG: hypothetical protein SPK23_01880 [Eubacteriales bacterium]|nr:hypothetical protein [Clostridiales bacterium]MDY5835862.1 hypothetical protein [Eubacteriales bacterium]
MKRKITALLIFSLLFGIFLACLPAQVVLAEGEGDGQEQEKANTQKIILKWNHYDLSTGFYNPADKGKSVSFTYAILFTDTDKETGKRTGPQYYSEWMTYSGEIGEKKILTLSRENVKDINEQIHEFVTFEGVYLPIYSENKIYGVSGGLNSNTLEVNALFCQNMNLNVEQKLADGLTLDPEEEIPIRYTVAKTEDGELTYPLRGNAGIIEREVTFKPGDPQLWKTDEAGKEDKFYYAVHQNSLNQFSPYTDKYREFELRAEFAGDQADALKERYDLKVTGNDLDGWTVTLSAKEVLQEMAELTFDPAEGHWENGSQDPVKMTAPVGESITIPAGPTLDGHNFLYWEGSLYHPGDSYTVVGDHTFTAHYEEYPEIIVNAPIVLDNSGTITVPLDQPQASSPQAQAPVAVLQDNVRALPATGSAQSSSLIIGSFASTLLGILLQHTR